MRFFVCCLDTVYSVHYMGTCDWCTEKWTRSGERARYLYIARGFLCNTLCLFFIRNKMASHNETKKRRFFGHLSVLLIFQSIFKATHPETETIYGQAKYLFFQHQSCMRRTLCVLGYCKNVPFLQLNGSRKKNFFPKFQEFIWRELVILQPNSNPNLMRAKNWWNRNG